MSEGSNVTCSIFFIHFFFIQDLETKQLLQVLMSRSVYFCVITIEMACHTRDYTTHNNIIKKNSYRTTHKKWKRKVALHITKTDFPIQILHMWSLDNTTFSVSLSPS